MSATFRTFLRQAEQISGSATYDDTLLMSGAETYLEKSLEGDLNYIRSQLKAIVGETNWYDTPSVTLADIEHDEQGMSGSFLNIYTFTGMDDRNDSTPTYSSINYVTDGNSLEAAIGDLDAQVKSNYDGYTTFATAAQTFTGMDDAFDSTPTYLSTNYVANNDSLETAISKLDAAVDVDKEVERVLAHIDSGSAHTIPGSYGHAAGDGSTMDLYLNGQLLQSNTGTEFRDYIESGTDEIKFTFKVKANSYLTYIIRQ